MSAGPTGGCDVPKLVMRLAPLPTAADRTQPPSSRHVVDLGEHGRAPMASTPLARWSASVAAAHDPCMVVDAQEQVLSISASAAELLGCSDAGVIGRPLLDVIELVDFDTGSPRPDYAARISPLTVLQSGVGLNRSLVRVRHRDGTRVTIDASAAPLHDVRGQVVGSITFLAQVRG
jgi:PAS domain S-box-containing protein